MHRVLVPTRSIDKKRSDLYLWYEHDAKDVPTAASTKSPGEYFPQLRKGSYAIIGKTAAATVAHPLTGCLLSIHRKRQYKASQPQVGYTMTDHSLTHVRVNTVTDVVMRHMPMTCHQGECIHLISGNFYLTSASCSSCFP